MKNFSQRTACLTAVYFLFILATQSLLADESTSQIGLLWQIDKPGSTPSYLLGTIHSEDQRVIQLPDAISSRFEKADSVSLELLMDIPTILKSTKAMFFQGDESLDQIIDKALFDKIVTIMQKYQMPPMMVKKFKPWAVVATFSTPPPKTGTFLDLQLYKKAQALGIRTYGLEKVEEQLAVFERLSLKQQISLLKDTMKYIDEMPTIFNKLHELYLKRNLTALMEFSIEYMRKSSEDKALIDSFYEGIVDKRNITMVKRMEKRLKEGNAFIAVGALHLPGKNGILNLLQKRGYQVSAVY
jgi:uncharacterized protein